MAIEKYNRPPINPHNFAITKAHLEGGRESYPDIHDEISEPDPILEAADQEKEKQQRRKQKIQKWLTVAAVAAGAYSTTYVGAQVATDFVSDALSPISAFGPDEFVFAESVGSAIGDLGKDHWDAVAEIGSSITGEGDN